jgi:hypothetical protein
MDARPEQLVPPEDDDCVGGGGACGELRPELTLAAPTAEVVEALRTQLLPRLPFGQVLSAYVDATPLDTLINFTRWSLFWTAGPSADGATSKRSLSGRPKLNFSFLI